MTDIEKYKSVAIKIDSYKVAKPMADEKYMSMGAFVRYLIDKEYDAHPDKLKLTNGDDTKTTNKKKSSKKRKKRARAKPDQH
mgnify:FL=1